MTIEEKLAEFLAAGIRTVSMVPLTDLGDLGIKRAESLGNCLFECGVNLESPVISRSPSSFIGCHSYMNNGGYMRNDVFIGRYCSIGRRVTLGAGSHPVVGLGTHPLLVYGKGRAYNDEENEILGNRPVRSRHTVLGNDVWIGDGVVVLQGLRIGTGAVVGANAVVTKDVPDYAIVAGTPARVVRYRFPPEMIGTILASRWWNYPIEIVRSHSVNNLFDFIEEWQESLSRGIQPQDYETYSIQK